MTPTSRSSRTLQVALVSLSTLLASQGLAQSSTEKPALKPLTPTPSQPSTAEPKSPDNSPRKLEAKPEVKPAAQPEHKLTMEEKKMEEAAKPGPMHEILKKGVGLWSGAVKTYGPDGKAQESTCMTSVVSLMEGRYTQARSKGKMGDRDFEGQGVYGYNNVTKQFEASWIDSMTTGVMFMTGKYDEAKKQLTWTGKFVDVMDNKEKTMREVDTFVDNEHSTIEFYVPGPDGKEFKCMEISNTRQAIKSPVGTPAPGGAQGTGLKKIPAVRPAPTGETRPESKPDPKPEPQPEPK